MTPEEFIAKWRDSTLTEKSASQAHFLDLCELLDVPKPQEVDKRGTEYTFEKAVKKAGGGKGFADVWKHHCFGWEYKGPRKNLVEAYSQLKGYADALENPPLLIVSDMQEIRIHTNFTDAISQTHVIPLRDLMGVETRRLLRNCFADPQKLRPEITREGVTRDAAKAFGAIAKQLRDRKYEPRRVAHFLNRIIFCLFVEDIDLLPDRLFADILEESVKSPDKFAPMLADLFRAMKDKNGRFGMVSVPWFNGGLFDDEDVLPLGGLEINDLARAARLDWSAIEPSIFGTLFEAGLDPEKREVMASLFDPKAAPKKKGINAWASGDKGVGIHYTDPATIMKIVEPVVIRPLRQEWKSVKAEVAKHRAARDKAKSDSARTRHEQAARDAWGKFREKLGRFRVLDPACGSGNFLYLSLLNLKNFDLEVIEGGQKLGLPLDDQRVGPNSVLGIEINPYAAELARVTIWIGELQWQLKNSFRIRRAPILGRLDGIENRDALLNADGTEAVWPKADVVVGNPPFLGGKRMRTMLGDKYVDKLFAAYDGKVLAESDLVAYWFAKAWERIKAGTLSKAGLVGTNSIRGGASRRIVDLIASDGIIFDAWDDEPWVLDGAAVRVSMVCFTKKDQSAGSEIRLDGHLVKRINSDLTSATSDLTTAHRLTENASIAFMGDTKGGAFDVDGDLARKWLRLPMNPNGRPNSDVLRPWMNGLDIARRPADKWIVDFGWEMEERAAALYEAPFAHILATVKPERANNNREHYRTLWWRHVEPRPGLWRAVQNWPTYFATPRVAKHRVFVRLASTICPDSQLIVIARADNTTLGLLHSRFHEAWALRLGTSLEDRPRYTPSTTFETFPFPEGLTPNIPAERYASDPRAKAIALAAKRLDELRRAWLNPPDLVNIVPEVVPGYPDRIVPKGAASEAELKKRTLTNLYNERPTWLANAHRDLDAAVAAAYGWPADITEEDALARLLALNLERAAKDG